MLHKPGQTDFWTGLNQKGDLVGTVVFFKNFIQIVLFFCGIVLAGCAGSGKLDSSIERDDNKRSVDKSHFFWKVSDDNSSLWILGSVHFADSSFYPLDSVIEVAFDNADELAVEIDLNDDSTSTELSSKMVQDGMLPKGETLSSVLPRNIWNSLDSLCAAWNFPVMALQRLRPWFAATTLSAVAIQRSGIQAEYGIDAVLMDRAATGGKAIVGLETAEEQVDALSGSSDDPSKSDSAGVFYLKTTLREIAGLDSMVTRMMRAWKTGNDSLLRAVMNEEFCEDGTDSCEDDSESEKMMKDDLEKRIYTTRNSKMADSIAEFLKEDRNVFVVIGAAHLVLDKDNVIELLKRKGFKVQRF